MEVIETPLNNPRTVGGGLLYVLRGVFDISDILELLLLGVDGGSKAAAMALFLSKPTIFPVSRVVGLSFLFFAAQFS